MVFLLGCKTLPTFGLLMNLLSQRVVTSCELSGDQVVIVIHSFWKNQAMHLDARQMSSSSTYVRPLE